MSEVKTSERSTTRQAERARFLEEAFDERTLKRGELVRE